MDVTRKGNNGIRITWMAALAFFLAFIGSTTLAFLLLGFVLVTEKNDWLTTQCLQAFLLCFVSSVLSTFNSILYDTLYQIPLLGDLLSGLIGLCIGLIELVVLVLALLSLFKAAKGQDANLPVIGNIAAAAFRCVPTAQQAAYTGYQAAQPAQPVQQPVQQPAQPVQPTEQPEQPQQ